MMAYAYPFTFYPQPRKITMGIEQDASGKKTMYELSPALIEIEPGFNVRTDMGDMESLTADIRFSGVKMPLQIRREGSRYFLVDGHRRLQAALAAVVRTVPCVMEEKGATEADRVFSMLSRNAGKPLTDVEQGEAYRRLIGFGNSLKAIGKRTGHTAEYIQGCMSLAAHPELAKQGMKPTAAGKLAKAPSAKMTEAVERGAVTQADVESMLKGKPKWLGKRRITREWQRFNGAFDVVRMTEMQLGYLRGLEFVTGRGEPLEIKIPVDK